MYSLDNTSGVTVMPPVKSQVYRHTEPRWFTEGGNGAAPSYPGADWFNIVQAELLNVLKEGKVNPAKAELTQLSKAIKNMIVAARATTLAGYGVTDFVLKNLSTEDLDTLKVAGFYAQGHNANATTARHYPEAKAGALTVQSSAYSWQQRYVIFDNGRTYIRNMQSGGTWSPWWRVDALDSAPTSRTMTAGNGLTGGGSFGANRTFTLGTPSTLGAGSKNAVTAESHTHAIDTATTSRAGIVQLSSNTTGTSTTRAATESAVKALNDAKANLASPTFTGAPKAPTPAKTVNDTTIATTAYVKQLIADLVGGAPTTLDTLKEISDALGRDVNLRTTLLAEIAKKANASHTHTASNIGNFSQAVSGLFARKISQNGWTKLPNGIIIQWGKLDVEGVHQDRNCIFPVAFNQVWAIAESSHYPNGNWWGNMSAGATIKSYNNTSFIAQLHSDYQGSGGSNAFISWIAIGN